MERTSRFHFFYDLDKAIYITATKIREHGKITSCTSEAILTRNHSSLIRNLPKLRYWYDYGSFWHCIRPDTYGPKHYSTALRKSSPLTGLFSPLQLSRIARQAESHHFNAFPETLKNESQPFSKSSKTLQIACERPKHDKALINKI
jgi:hypothetical protein